MLVLNQGEEEWEERCLSSTGRADKEPTWDTRKQRKGEGEEAEEIGK